MVYSGKPSAGCENCRKAKKSCDQQLPACGRCSRLGKACGGYRDMNSLIFKQETGTTRRRSSGGTVSPLLESGETFAMAPLTRQPSPVKLSRALSFFFREFVSTTQLALLQNRKPSDFLLKPIIACALAAMANRDGDVRGRETSRRSYVEAINATQEALRHPEKVKEDDTLIAVYLLSMFERISWDHHTSMSSWRLHIEGATEVVRLRGPEQLRKSGGASLFRELRHSIVLSAMISEIEVPEFVTQWTETLPRSLAHSLEDQVGLLGARLATLRAAFANASIPDDELSRRCNTLEQDFVSWAQRAQDDGSVYAFDVITEDESSSHIFNGVRHDYNSLDTHRSWNKLRAFRIMLSRLQETIERRSWPILSQPVHRTSGTEHLAAIRQQMATDICLATACVFGNETSSPLPPASIANGYCLVLPLFIAGTCFLEKLISPMVTPGGNQIMVIEEPMHVDLMNSSSINLAWVIGRLDYLADKVGIQWAAYKSTLLRGGTKVYYDLPRSKVLNDKELNDTLQGQSFDLGDIFQFLEEDEL